MNSWGRVQQLLCVLQGGVRLLSGLKGTSWDVNYRRAVILEGMRSTIAEIAMFRREDRTGAIAFARDIPWEEVADMAKRFEMSVGMLVLNKAWHRRVAALARRLVKGMSADGGRRAARRTR